MECIEHTIQVSWQHRVLFSDGIFMPSNPSVREVLSKDDPSRRGKVLVLMENALASAQPTLTGQIVTYFELYQDGLELVCPPLRVSGGEAIKNTYTPVAQLHAEIERHHLDRHSYILIVGGGALLDMAGFAATTAHRGIRHVRVPTTTLSQCDSGVGVKNGINLFGKKNFIGTFSPPFAVINDFLLLATLPPRDKRAGYAEAVKVACIRDREFFESLERDALQLCEFNPEAMRRLIYTCARLHLDHIAYGGDPFEMGSRRPLDFGHWAAHQLEQLSHFKISHGEAVAMGIALDVIYSRRLGFLSSAEAERVLRLLEALGFNLFAPELLHENNQGELVLLDGLNQFREHLGGQLCITLLRSLGDGFEVHDMDQRQIVESIYELQALHQVISGDIVALA